MLAGLMENLMEKWKKNLYVVFFAEMIAITGMSFIIPFLPSYVKELGITDANLVAQWSGWLMGAPALVMIIISPIWGFLADRVGRKPMGRKGTFWRFYRHLFNGLCRQYLPIVIFTFTTAITNRNNCYLYCLNFCEFAFKKNEI